MCAAGDLVIASKLYHEACGALNTLLDEDEDIYHPELVDELGAIREALALIQGNLAAPAFHASPGATIQVCVSI